MTTPIDPSSSSNTVIFAKVERQNGQINSYTATVKNERAQGQVKRVGGAKKYTRKTKKSQKSSRRSPKSLKRKHR
jgi:hypothetical protein